jgi:hydrogenase maturation protease
MNLRDQLESTLQGRLCLMGLGNRDYGDDGLGVQLVEELVEVGITDIVIAGTSPETYIGVITDQEFDHVVFVDAVEFGGEPGSVIFLNSSEIDSRYPQISTHKISVSMFAKFAESNGVTKAWLLGVQPESTRERRGLTPKVSATLKVLREVLFRLKTKEVPVC